MTLHLADGDRVCIVGGGPAGCFAALHLLKLAGYRDLELEVLIFEPRDFTLRGPGGCNRCAGILSSRLMRGLAGLELTIPDEVVQSELKTYAIHLDEEVLAIHQPNPDRQILSVYRGGGPRIGVKPPSFGFDIWLLESACLQGAIHVPERVRTITHEEHPVVHTRQNRYEADLMVFACGVNSHSPLSSDFNYEPPETVIMAQDEFLLPDDVPIDQVSAYFDKTSDMLFAAMIPKGQYANVSLLGEGMRLDSIREFVANQNLPEAYFSEERRLCGCTPKSAIGAAKGYYGSRWVAIGDAAVTRLYKDGIGSAFYTAEAAMQTVITHGISERAFKQNYAPYCNRIRTDNRYGRLLIKLWQRMLHSPHLLSAWLNAVNMEGSGNPAQPVHAHILWGMLTGDDSYRTLFWHSCSPNALRSLLRGFKRSF